MTGRAGDRAGSKRRSRVVIPPHVRLDGPQLAGWRPKVSSQRKFPIRCEPDIPVVLPDGTTLRGDLYRPDVAGRYPALVAWSTYPKELQQTGLPLPLNEAGVSGYLAQHGYAHLIVSARGTGRSGGDHQPQLALQEQKDVADAIEWVATQEWCDGSVGMVGMSYFAIIQSLAAAGRPPHLKAIFPFVGLSDFYRHFVYNYGAPSASFFANYYSLLGSTRGLRVGPNVRHLIGHLLDHGPVQRATLAILQRARERPATAPFHPEAARIRAYVSQFFDETLDGRFYAGRPPWPVLEKIEVPAPLGTHWGNLLHSFGTFEAWHRIPGDAKRLFIGPPYASWPWASYQEEAVAWYDHHLKGRDNGVADLPRVRYWLIGADRWETADDWPGPH